MQSTPSNNEKKNNSLSTPALYELAAKRDIPVLPFALECAPSLSIMDDKGRCTVGIRPDLSGRVEHVCLGHEMGHCVTGAFYRVTTSAAVRGKSEYKADKWAIYHLIPPAALEKAVKEGITRPHELAEHFEVTEDFMLKALDFYACVRPMQDF